MTIINVPFIDLTQIRDQIKEDSVEPGIIKQHRIRRSPLVIWSFGEVPKIS